MLMHVASVCFVSVYRMCGLKTVWVAEDPQASGFLDAYREHHGALPYIPWPNSWRAYWTLILATVHTT
jgi:hypothetical protein